MSDEQARDPHYCDDVIRGLRDRHPLWTIAREGDGGWSACREGFGVLRGRTPVELQKRLEIYGREGEQA